MKSVAKAHEPSSFCKNIFVGGNFVGQDDLVSSQNSLYLRCQHRQAKHFLLSRLNNSCIGAEVGLSRQDRHSLLSMLE